MSDKRPWVPFLPGPGQLPPKGPKDSEKAAAARQAKIKACQARGGVWNTPGGCTVKKGTKPTISPTLPTGPIDPTLPPDVAGEPDVDVPVEPPDIGGEGGPSPAPLPPDDEEGFDEDAIPQLLQAPSFATRLAGLPAPRRAPKPKPAPRRRPTPKSPPIRTRPGRRPLPRRSPLPGRTPGTRIPLSVPGLLFRRAGVLGAALTLVPFVVKGLIKADEAGTRAWAEKIYGAKKRSDDADRALGPVVPGVARLPNPRGAPLPEVRVVGKPLSDRLAAPRPADKPSALPQPGLRPVPTPNLARPVPFASPATVPKPGIDFSFDIVRAPRYVPHPPPKRAPRDRTRPAPGPSSPPEINPLSPAPRFPGAGPITPPGLNPQPLPGVLTLPQLGPVPLEELDRCKCPKKKPRKKRQPRTECRKGTYVETRSGLQKSPKEIVECQ